MRPFGILLASVNLFQFLVLLSGEKATCFEFPNPVSQFLKPILNNDLPPPQMLLEELEDLINMAPRNGIDTPVELESQILDVCQKLERQQNPNVSPSKRPDLMNGFWNMRWTNFEPAAPSSGKLGPLVGDVFQDIDLDRSVAKNILRVNFPPICGALTAKTSAVNDFTVAISFQQVGNKLGGIIPLGPKVVFEPGKEVRLWEHVYLDENYRILYARRREEKEERGFVYVMKRADELRFDVPE